jgi:hypothetical protein
MPPIFICLSFSFTTGILSDLIMASTFFIYAAFNDTCAINWYCSIVIILKMLYKLL